jgi:hypothetical protein
MLATYIYLNCASDRTGSSQNKKQSETQSSLGSSRHAEENHRQAWSSSLTLHLKY